MGMRIGNAVFSYVRYLEKLFWPKGLSVLYMHPNMPGGTPLTAWQIVGAGVLLVAITVLVIRVRSQKYMLVGWLWYIGTLVPVIGFVQVGNQALADRYTYVPLIGLFIIIAWGGADLLKRYRQNFFRAVTIVGAIVLGVLIACSNVQVQYWRNAETLFVHSLEIDPMNPVINLNFSKYLTKKNRLSESSKYLERVLQVQPDNYEAHNNLGNVFQKQRRFDEAINHYHQAIEAKPDNSRAHNNMANVLASQGDLSEAIRYYNRALQLDPDYASAHSNLGVALSRQGKLDEAIYHFRQALRIKPRFIGAYFNLANALSLQGQIEEAIQQYRRVLQLEGDSAKAYDRIGGLLAAQGKLNEAMQHFHKAMQLEPGWPLPINNIAWLLATRPDAKPSDADEAIRLAKRAVELSNYRNMKYLDTLGVAYASAGQFDRAITTAQAALALSVEAGAGELTRQIRGRLELYRQGKPYREPVPNLKASNDRRE